MRRFSLALALLASPAMAQDFSAGSTANAWNLYAEKPAFFEAKVVDLLCELTGDCPADCGAGKRQLGLLRSVDNVMVLPLKNGQPVFSGAAADLAPYCGQTVEVDGLMIDDPDLGAKHVYQVQKIRLPGGEWEKANRFTKVWGAENPEAAGEGPWFRRDPRVNSEIAKDGYLGLGLETDEAFIKDWF
ncbi:hypothetical protein OEZ49_15135 [Ruegeria sp. WL0004]|uniref:Uncharacterized protein n=1 Tax=Ruegeria marisflavi TaxID=2984152 RepID=A0ABT2WT86_9RHOB|nr:hypothetical protein [Ruegeria sp. WL0004]MCU9839109.1 hypothetical protein [Ruegeria sp. WL0004]